MIWGRCSETERERETRSKYQTVNVRIAGGLAGESQSIDIIWDRIHPWFLHDSSLKPYRPYLCWPLFLKHKWAATLSGLKMCSLLSRESLASDMGYVFLHHKILRHLHQCQVVLGSCLPSFRIHLPKEHGLFGQKPGQLHGITIYIFIHIYMYASAMSM